MKKLALLSCCVLILLGTNLDPISVIAGAKGIELTQVDYQKWGSLAVRMAKEAYPSYEVSDYQYLGREERAGNIAVDRFEFIIKKGAEKRDIVADVTFNTQTGELISLNFKEK